MNDSYHHTAKQHEKFNYMQQKWKIILFLRHSYLIQEQQKSFNLLILCLWFICWKVLSITRRIETNWLAIKVDLNKNCHF